MEYFFRFQGGVRELAPGIKEKFHLLGIIGGKEVFIFQAERAGMVEKVSGQEVADKMFGQDSPHHNVYDWYKTSIKHWKVFNYLSGFGVRKQLYSIVFELRAPDTPAPTIVVRPASILEKKTGQRKEHPWCFFATKALVLSRDATQELLEGDSLGFFKRQPPMPIPIIRELVIVDKSALRINVRQIRFRSGVK